MSDIHKDQRNSDGSLSYQGAFNTGANEANRGAPCSSQQWNETRREYEIRQDGYNSANK